VLVHHMLRVPDVLSIFMGALGDAVGTDLRALQENTCIEVTFVFYVDLEHVLLLGTWACWCAQVRRGPVWYHGKLLPIDNDLLLGTDLANDSGAPRKTPAGICAYLVVLCNMLVWAAKANYSLTLCFYCTGMEGVVAK
jgi:hypothetical protein